mgnify:CR=1 FL=1
MNFIVSAQPPKKIVEQAKKFFQEGEKLFNQKKYRLAIEKYNQSIALVPKNPIANFRKGGAGSEFRNIQNLLFGGI